MERIDFPEPIRFSERFRIYFLPVLEFQFQYGSRKLVQHCHGCCLDLRLNVEIMLDHVNLGVSAEVPNCLQRNSLRLKLADVGMSAAVRRQHPHSSKLFQRLLVVLSEATGITKPAWNLSVPDILLSRVPKEQCTGAKLLWHRNLPIAGLGLGWADLRRTLHHSHCLLDRDAGTILRNVSGFQSQQLLRPHSRSQQKPDAVSDTIIR